jgi:translation initiation factor IF-2
MSKKVFELANEVGMGAIDLVEKLRGIGLNVRNHMVVLTADELEQATKELGFSGGPAVAEKKAKTTTRKKVAKKKVTKKVIKKATASGEESAEVTDEAPAERKVITVKRKPKIIKKKAPSESAGLDSEVVQGSMTRLSVVSHPEVATPEVIAEEKTATTGKPSDNSDKEKMHSFTPVFIPEKTEKKDEENKEKTFRNTSATTAATAVDSKKRIGDLASQMTKKTTVNRSQDLTKLRSEEQLKMAKTMGSSVYTPARRKKIYSGPKNKTEITEVKDSKRVIVLHDGATADLIAEKLSQKFTSFANKCLELNLLVKKEDFIGMTLATQIATIYGYRIENRAFDEDKSFTSEEKVNKDDLPLRNAIITVMGHVDHGKTTLLDFIRKEKVTAGEAGGITQHIGAYSVNVNDTTLTFLDTPGHAAFGSMRQRGADVTDIVILVVAADDGVMPQTKESIKYAQNSGCPIIIAINKMDKEGVNPDRIKQELMEFGITPEEWGGDTQMVPISALQGDGVDDLLEAIKVQAEMMELRETAKGGAEGVVIESKVESGRGAVSTILIQKGTLKKGDSIVVGEAYGRARGLTDYAGNMVQAAGPSMPIQILGLNEVTAPGDTLHVVKSEREAKKVVENRVAARKALKAADDNKVKSIDDFFADIMETGEKKILKLIVRADVSGSYEAIKNALETLGNDEVAVEVIGGGVGAITDSDINLAESSEAYVVGFNMRPVTSARRLSDQKKIEIKTYSIIYRLIDDMTAALEGLLEPEYKEKFIGRAEVKDTFNIPKIGVIAGSSVIDGKIERGCHIRLLRAGKILFDGKLSTLKRFKDEVKEVKNGFECGIALEDYDDIKTEDIFEAYTLEEVKRKLEPSSVIL